jgi:integrase
VQSVKHRTILTICYAAGLRISEAVRLKVADVDSKRMVIRVEQGKGQKDRYVMLSPKLLEVLRAWWPVNKPKQWLFPADRVDSCISSDAVELACQKAVPPRLGRAQISGRLPISQRSISCAAKC